MLHMKYTDRQLSAILPEEVRADLIGSYTDAIRAFQLLRKPRPADLGRLLECKRRGIPCGRQL